MVDAIKLGIVYVLIGKWLESIECSGAREKKPMPSINAL